MQRLGIVNCFLNHLLHRVWAVFLVVAFFLSVDSWGACTVVTESLYNTGSHTCNGAGVCTLNETQVISNAICTAGSITVPKSSCNNGNTYIVNYRCNGGSRYIASISYSHCSGYGDYAYIKLNYCSTQCEAKEIECNSKGWIWDAANCQCQDPTICGDLRAQCEEVGGVFHGVGNSVNGENCCRASCNVCGGDAFKKLYDMKRKICCDRMQAPPLESSVCSTVDLPPSSCGMNWSRYSELTSNEWACRDPSLSPEASQSYNEQCFETSSSSTEDSSNSGDSSSGAGGGDNSSNSGSQYPEGCDECPWLDSILDTLTLQKQTVDAIYNCIIYPGLCSDNSSNDTPTPSDSNILAVLPYLDTSNRLNEQQIDAIKSLDTLLERLNFKDSIALMNDTLTWSAIYTAASSIQGHIDASNDTTRKWMSRIFERLKSTNDTLINHLDSLKVSFVDTSISSLNDSAVKYFQLGLKYDSIYNKVFKDSIKSVHDAISDIGVNIGYGLGYGDTASKTLRNDLEGIKGAVDSLRGIFGAGAVDTNLNAGIWGNGEGERIGDSIVNALGWDQLKNMNIDSVYSHALSNVTSDTVGNGLNDSISGVLARLNDSLARRNEDIKSKLPDSLNKWADSLVVWAPFAGFDSLIYESIGAHIPNRDDCPEDCQKWTVSIPVIHLYSYTFDYGLCLGRAPLGNQSVLAFIKLLLRIVVSWTCIVLIYRTLTKTDLL